MPPGSTSRDYDEFSGEYATCRNCGERMANCECGEFEAADLDEYDGRFDDEGD